MRKFTLALGVLWLGSLQPTYANSEKGYWYGSYTGSIGGIEMRIDLDHLPDGRSGTASISFIQGVTEITCPGEAHPEMCEELAARAKRSPNGAFFAESEGVLYEGQDEAFVAFRFLDETNARLLAIQRDEKASRTVGIRFYHMERGIDAQLNAKRGVYFCEWVQCSEEVRNELKNDPAKALGLFGSRTFLPGFNPTLDERAAAHQSSQSSAVQNNGFGKYESVGQFLTAVWKVASLENLELGEVRLFGTGSKVWGGLGEMTANSDKGDSLVQVKLTETGRNETSVIFGITPTPNRLNDAEFGQLRVFLPVVPNDEISAVLTRASSNHRVVLKRLGTYEGEVEGDVDDAGNKPDITALRFGLRNVPTDRKLIVRQSPDRNARSVGELPASANDVQVSRCEPSIDTTKFFGTTYDGKLEILSGVWCQVSSREERINNGFVLGRYLLPEDL